jgi:hypothetical protein
MPCFCNLQYALRPDGLRSAPAKHVPSADGKIRLQTCRWIKRVLEAVAGPEHRCLAPFTSFSEFGVVSGVIAARRPAVTFGIDEVDVKITGRFNGMMASCSGTAEQAPGVVFEATLFLGQDQSPESDRKRAAVKFDAGKLPKGADSRYNARNPFARGPSRI